MSDRIAVMNKGSIQQIAPPAEVYHRPANRFVASFIGVSNILAGRVTSVGGAGVTIGTESGLTLHAEGASVGAGDQVSVLIRPERFEPHEGPSGDNRPWLEAVIEQVVFVGSELHLHSRLSDGTRVVALDRRSGASVSAWQEGGPVRLYYEPASLHVMAEERA